MIGKKAVCVKCARLIVNEEFGTDKPFGWYCAAYPDGDIPPEISVGGNPHTSPVEGDDGILFVAGPNEMNSTK